MKLTDGERKAILKGDSRAIKRQEKPDIGTGRTVLAWTRGGKQFVGGSDRERTATAGATIDIPRRPSVWVQFAEPEEREDGWLVQIEVHDSREPRRYIGSAPSPRDSWTEDAERGYTGTSRTAVDHLEAVDDHTLRGQTTEARNRFSAFRNEEKARRERHKQEAAVRQRLREALSQLPGEKQVELLAQVERTISLHGALQSA